MKAAGRLVSVTRRQDHLAQYTRQAQCSQYSVCTVYQALKPSSCFRLDSIVPIHQNTRHASESAIAACHTYGP
ncbi:hypothetical protein CC2G_007684 [Coprinopsis cinerea AmutBmut pab1-1]|nr:hypothetical protein CC2G_007684 [Coprinopsis cinerea AmutBmut pab1-1]